LLLLGELLRLRLLLLLEEFLQQPLRLLLLGQFLRL